MTIAKKFESVVKVLKDEGLIENLTDLARCMGSYHHVLLGICRGKRFLSDNLIGKLITVFRIRPDYLYGVSAEMFIGDEVPTKGHVIDNSPRKLETAVRKRKQRRVFEPDSIIGKILD